MPTTLGDLATLVGGRLVGGSAERSMVAAATLETAGTDDLSFLDAADKLHLLAKSRAGAVIVPVGIGPLDRPSIEVADVHVAFTAVIEVFRPKRHSQAHRGEPTGGGRRDGPHRLGNRHPPLRDRGGRCRDRP